MNELAPVGMAYDEPSLRRGSRLNWLRGNRTKRGFIVQTVRRVHYAGEG
jgi:hypothetical protein